MHIFSDDDLVLKLLDDFDVRTINICVPLDNHGEWMNQHEAYRSISHRHRERFAWITSFDLPRFDDAGYCQTVIEQLEKDFADGAVAVKIWKNVGMVIVRGRHDAAILYEYAQPILPENAGFRFACGIPGGILMNFAFHIHPAYYTALTTN